MDLRTTYLGLELKNPVVASSSPLTSTLDNLRRLEDGGAGAVVLVSLFEESTKQDNPLRDYALSYGIPSSEEARMTLRDLTPEADSAELYLELIRAAKSALEIPVIASLNGVTPGGWTRYAQEIERAGADALELNLYTLPTDPERTSVEVEGDYFKVLHDVKENLKLPLAVKLSPFLSTPANMALRLAKAGADGLVLFNRFYQPDFDIETRRINLELTLSRPHEIRLPLRWVAVLYGHVPADLALTGGVHSHKDVLKAVMAGAKVAMMASELLQKGPRRIGEITQEIAQWLAVHGHDSLNELRGVMSQLQASEPAAFERTHYIHMLESAS